MVNDDETDLHNKILAPSDELILGMNNGLKKPEILQIKTNIILLAAVLHDK